MGHGYRWTCPCGVSQRGAKMVQVNLPPGARARLLVRSSFVSPVSPNHFISAESFMSSGWALFTTYSGQVCQAVQVVYQEAVALGPCLSYLDRPTGTVLANYRQLYVSLSGGSEFSIYTYQYNSGDTHCSGTNPKVTSRLTVLIRPLSGATTRSSLLAQKTTTHSPWQHLPPRLLSSQGSQEATTFPSSTLLGS